MVAVVLNPTLSPARLRADLRKSIAQLTAVPNPEKIEINVAGAGRKLAELSKQDIMRIREDSYALLRQYTIEEILNQYDNFDNKFFNMTVDGRRKSAGNLARARLITDTVFLSGKIHLGAILTAIARAVYMVVTPRTTQLGTAWSVWYDKKPVVGLTLDVEPGKSVWFVSNTDYGAFVNKYVMSRSARKINRRARTGKKAKARSTGESMIVKVRKTLQKLETLRGFSVRARVMPWTHTPPSPAARIRKPYRLAISVRYYPSKAFNGF